MSGSTSLRTILIGLTTMIVCSALARSAAQATSHAPLPATTQAGCVPAADGTTRSPPAAPENEETPTSILDRAVRAMGGAVVIDGLKTLRLVTRSTRWLSRGQAVESLATTWIAFPDRYRREERLPFGTVTTLLTPEGAFVVGPESATPMPETQRVALDDAVYRNPIAFLRTRNHPYLTLTVEGEDDLGGRPITRVRFDLHGRSTQVAFDIETGLPVEMTYSPRTLAGSPTVVIEYDDFRCVDGLQYPFLAVGSQDGSRVFEGRVQDLTVDEDFDDTLFEPRATPVEMSRD